MILFRAVAVVTALFGAVSVMAQDYPDPPAPRNSDEAYVYVQGDVSIVGAKKRYSRVVAVEVDPGSQWASWKIDSTVFFPKPSIRLNNPASGKLATCGAPKIATRGTIIVLYAPIRNESTLQNISCRIRGYVRMTK